MQGGYKHFLILCLFAVGTCQGVYRHDVSIDKHKKLAQDPAFDPAGYFTIDDSSRSGSGVLVTSNHVITAAHLFWEYDYVPDTIERDGMQYIINKRSNPRVIKSNRISFVLNDQIHQVRKLYLYPGYSDTTSAPDLAILELSNPIEKVIPAIIYSGLLKPGDTITWVGSGYYGSADKWDLNHNEKGLKLAGMNVIDSTFWMDTAGTMNNILSDFDHPSDSTCCNKVGDWEPLPLEYSPEAGDSGCGGFVQVDGQYLLAAVYAFGGYDVMQQDLPPYYGSLQYGTQISPALNWLESLNIPIEVTKGR